MSEVDTGIEREQQEAGVETPGAPLWVQTVCAISKWTSYMCEDRTVCYTVL